MLQLLLHSHEQHAYTVHGLPVKASHTTLHLDSHCVGVHIFPKSRQHTHYHRHGDSLLLRDSFDKCWGQGPWNFAVLYNMRLWRLIPW